MPAEKKELNQMFTFYLHELIDLLNPTHLILPKFYAKINLKGIELMLNPNLHQTQNTPQDSKNQKIAVFQKKKQPLEKNGWS